MSALSASTETVNLQISNKLQLKQKEVDDVLGGEEAWKNVDRTEGRLLGLKRQLSSFVLESASGNCCISSAGC